MVNWITNLALVFSLVFIFLACPRIVFSQVEEISSFKQLSKKDGLSQSTVFSIAEDADGFLWFGTRDGLNKYDGYQFKVFRKDGEVNSLVSNDIRTLYLDPLSENLWIGTLEGLSCLDRITNTFKNYKHDPGNNTTIASNRIASIKRDSKGRLWIGTAKGLSYFDGQNFHAIPFENGEESGINSIYEDSKHNIWIGSRIGLFKLLESEDDESFEIVSAESGIGQVDVLSLLEGPGSDLWIGSNGGGLYKWNITKGSVKNYLSDSKNSRSLSDNSIRTLCFDDQGQLWIGTFDGLNRYDYARDDFKVFRSFDNNIGSLSDKSIKSMYNDKNGSLWIGTYYGGINQLVESYNRFYNYVYSPNDNQLSAPVVSCFAEDESNNLWIGTEGGGLNYYDAKKNVYNRYTYTGKAHSISGSNVKQILVDGHSIWIGFFNEGLDKLDLQTGLFTNYNANQIGDNKLSSNNVYGLLKEGNRLWIATYSGGLNILDLNTGQFQIYNTSEKDSTSLSSDFTRLIYKDSKDNIWIGTEKGVNRVLRDENDLPERFERFLENIKIYSIQEDSEGVIWIGTISNGLYKYDPSTKSIENYTTSDGLAGNTVFGIVEDEKRFLWLSTNDGISRFSSDKEQFLNFNNSNGLLNSEFNFNAYYKKGSGEILFGGINGYTQFDPARIVTNKHVPDVEFTGIYQNNVAIPLENSINYTERVEFKYNQANFRLDFAALDYLSPLNNYYSYKLEGIDKEWNTVQGIPSATYTIQRHGKYTFKLRGGNSAGVWSPETREIEILVLPPPWRTWWAYLMYVALAFASLFGIYRYFNLKASYLIEIKEKEQKEELHKLKLNFFTNVAHEFRTPLTLIIGPLEDLVKNFTNFSNNVVRDRLLKISDNSQRMLNLVNQLMTFRRMEAGYEPLNVEEVSIFGLLNRVFDLFKDHARLLDIEYSFHPLDEDQKIYLDREKIEKVLFNLLSNAFKFTPHGGSIKLVVKEDQSFVNIIVEDSGSGISKSLHEQIFQRFYEKNNKSENLIKGTGIGLALSKQLVKLHKGEISVASEEGQGASFKIALLKGSSHFDSQAFKPKVNEGVLVNVPLTEIAPDGKDKRSVVTKSNMKVLIVDDNQEILDYMSSIFNGRYKVLTASNGIEAIQKIEDYQVDLVISDVMMPEMDGIELCRRIKSDIKYSHIPLILLTAKSMLLDKIEGLDSGATDYISKPFHPDELKLKVNNILEQQRLIKEALQAQEFSPSEIEVASVDEQFLIKLKELMQENISNPEFKIEQFAHELAVSRALLFTKIKALTDMTPKNFLKSYRMKRAIQLLESGKMTIHEVAFAVGYKDPKYFSRVFQKEHGKNPSEHIAAFKI